MKVLVVAGASGGHIFPAMSLISALKEKDKGISALLVLPLRSLKAGIVFGDYNIKYISTSAFGRGINSKNLIALVNLLKGFGESLRLLLEYKPDIVVGFGSSDSLPCLFFAWLFRIKTLIHEQNVLPGRANRLLAKFVDRVAVSFAKTKGYLKINQDKIIVTGNPVRRELKMIDRVAALDFFGLSRERITILVMGGSQGSRSVNRAFLAALSKLPAASDIQAIHICGRKDYAGLIDKYKGLSFEVKLFAFLKEMQFAYSACDFVVSRAGATTIAELLYFGLPAAIIPYPFAYAHQYNNAKVLEEEGRAVIIEDKDTAGEELARVLSGLISEPEKVKARRAKGAGYSNDPSAGLLAGLVMASV